MKFLLVTQTKPVSPSREVCKIQVQLCLQNKPKLAKLIKQQNTQNAIAGLMNSSSISMQNQVVSGQILPTGGQDPQKMTNTTYLNCTNPYQEDIGLGLEARIVLAIPLGR